jgi:hypothetical protein
MKVMTTTNIPTTLPPSLNNSDMIILISAALSLTFTSARSVHNRIILSLFLVQVTVQEDVFVCYEILGPTSGQVLIRAFALHDAGKGKSSSSIPETQRSIVLSVLGTRPSKVSPGTVLVLTVPDPRLSCLHSTTSSIQSFVMTTSPSSSEMISGPVPPRSPLWDVQNLTQLHPTLNTHTINQLKAKVCSC